MLIALDYDHTYTAHPDLWDAFLRLINERFDGVTVMIVTNRSPNEPIAPVDVLYAGTLSVVYCSGQPKRKVIAARGLDVAIWIDDLPHLVDLGAGHPVARALGLP